jgi:hypothetical protein
MRNGALRFRLAQAAGKIRRFYKSTFRYRQAEQGLALRRGECNRCGRCCKILFRCPFLREENGEYSCRIYGRHFTACKLFPLEQADLAELDGECTFTFVTPPPAAGKTAGGMGETRDMVWRIS